MSTLLMFKGTRIITAHVTLPTLLVPTLPTTLDPTAPITLAQMVPAIMVPTQLVATQLILPVTPQIIAPIRQIRPFLPHMMEFYPMT